MRHMVLFRPRLTRLVLRKGGVIPVQKPRKQSSRGWQFDLCRRLRLGHHLVCCPFPAAAGVAWTCWSRAVWRWGTQDLRP